MMASRGMGAVLPSKMPKGSRKARRDDTNFTQFDEGGTVADKEKEEAVKFGVENPRLNLAKNAKELSGRLTAEKQLGKNTSLQAYLDANINKRGPGVQSGGVNLTHRFAEGGKVNAAGNYTKPGLRKKIVSQVKSAATQGTGAGQWSARKAQLVAKKYKEAGGGYKD
jgi:hypothetical protein